MTTPPTMTMTTYYVGFLYGYKGQTSGIVVPYTSEFWAKGYSFDWATIEAESFEVASAQFLLMVNEKYK